MRGALLDEEEPFFEVFETQGREVTTREDVFEGDLEYWGYCGVGWVGEGGAGRVCVGASDGRSTRRRMCSA